MPQCRFWLAIVRCRLSQYTSQLSDIHLSSDVAISIPSDVTIPTQNATSPIDTFQFELDGGVRLTSEKPAEATSYIPDSSDSSWWTAANNDLLLAFPPTSSEPSLMGSSDCVCLVLVEHYNRLTVSQTNPTSLAYYRGEMSLFDAPSLQNNLYLSPLSDFDALDHYELPTHIDPSLIMHSMNPSFAAPEDTARTSEENRAIEPNSKRLFMESSPTSWNLQNTVDSTGDLGTDSQPKFDLPNYLPTPPPQTDPIGNWPFLDWNAPDPAPSAAGPSTISDTVYAPNPLGASSSPEHKRPRPDPYSDDEPEEHAPGHTTKRQRKAMSSTPRTRGQTQSTEHGKGRRYPCPDPQCSQLFSRANDAGRHAKSFHREAYFPCDASDDCAASFKRLDSLRRHKRLVHNIHIDGCRCMECRNVPAIKWFRH